MLDGRRVSDSRPIVAEAEGGRLLWRGNHLRAQGGSGREMSGTETKGERLRGLLGEIEDLLEALRRRRAESPYPWDAAPIGEANALLERARAVLPGEPVDIPEPLVVHPAGEQLWRTPTDEALQLLETLQAAITTALEVAD
jgi:hypothetical protein